MVAIPACVKTTGLFLRRMLCPLQWWRDGLCSLLHHAAPAGGGAQLGAVDGGRCARKQPDLAAEQHEFLARAVMPTASLRRTSAMVLRSGASPAISHSISTSARHSSSSQREERGPFSVP
jgi:hypothetical protein